MILSPCILPLMRVTMTDCRPCSVITVAIPVLSCNTQHARGPQSIWVSIGTRRAPRPRSNLPTPLTGELRRLLIIVCALPYCKTVPDFVPTITNFTKKRLTFPNFFKIYRSQSSSIPSLPRCLFCLTMLWTFNPLVACSIHARPITEKQEQRRVSRQIG